MVLLWPRSISHAIFGHLIGLLGHISSPSNSLCKCPREDASFEHQGSYSQGVQINDTILARYCVIGCPCTVDRVSLWIGCSCIVEGSLFTHKKDYFSSIFAMCHASFCYNPTCIPHENYIPAHVKMK